MDSFLFTKGNFDVRQTAECGQVFRYKKITDKKYEFFSLDKKCVAENVEGGVLLIGNDIEYFKNYFDLNTDYAKIASALMDYPELTDAVRVGSGIRILRQDFFEALISFIISAYNNIKRIQGIIEKLCAKYGEYTAEGFYAFPSISALSSAEKKDLEELGLGFRAEYVPSAANKFEEIKKVIYASTNTDEKLKALMSVKGVGPKVADCAALFGLHITDSYPVDTWIFKSGKNEQLDTKKKVRDYYMARYGDNAGYAQQYIFYKARLK